MAFVPNPPRTGIVRPPSQWNHDVLTYMPWAHQNNAAYFVRFQGGQLPIPDQHTIPGIPNMMPPAETYIHPGDPCSSRSMVSPQVPYPFSSFPSFPSTSHCAPRLKRKFPCDPSEPIPAKQLVTERMLERLNGLSLYDPCSSGYVTTKSTSTALGPSSQMPTDDCFEFSESGAKLPSIGGGLDSGESTLIFTDTMKDILNATSLENRLAMNEVKKSTMALVPWSPPIINLDDQNYSDSVESQEKEEAEEDCEASMEM